MWVVELENRGVEATSQDITIDGRVSTCLKESKRLKPRNLSWGWIHVSGEGGSSAH